MFKKLYQSTTNSVQGAAILLALSAIMTQLFGLVRDKLLAHLVGPGPMLDVYYSAFRIPDILFVTVATLFSASILLPFLANYLNKNDLAGSHRFMRDSALTFSVLILVACALAYILFPYLSRGLVAGFDEQTRLLYIKIGRMLLLSQSIILGLSNLIATITQYYKHFIIWSFAPLFYNIGIIIGVLFYPQMGLTAVALGVLFGAIMHLAIQIPIIYKHGYLKIFGKQYGLGKYQFSEMLNVLKTALPRTISLSLNNLVMLVLIATATTMSVGSVSLFTFAYTIQAVPLTLIGLTFSVAAFPTLSKLFSEAKNNFDSEFGLEFKKEFKTNVRKIFALTTITAFVFIVFRLPLIDLLLGSGAFTDYHVLRTGWLLAIACIGMVPAGMVQLYLRALYATGNTKRPFIATLVTAISTIVITVVGLYVFKTTALDFWLAQKTGLIITDTNVLVLMLAVAVSSIINVLLLRGITKKYLGVRGTIDIKIVFKTLFIAIVANAVAYAFYAFFTSYETIKISSHIIFILCLTLDSFIIYVLAKKSNLPEVYEYMNVYISKLSKMFNYAGRIFVKQSK
jgi:putative peptidoglycan lipid II flippase